MLYSITDFVILIRHHLVDSASTQAEADSNIRELVSRLTPKVSPQPQVAEWVFCDWCGCAVDTAVIPNDGSCTTADGAFLCSTCLDINDAST